MGTKPAAPLIVGKALRWAAAARKLEDLHSADLSSEELNALSQLMDTNIQEAIVYRKGLPDEARLNLARNGESYIQSVISEDPPFSAPLTAFFLASDNERLRAAAAGGGPLTPAQVERILQDPCDGVSFPLLFREDMRPSDLSRAVWQHRGDLADRPSLPEFPLQVHFLLQEHDENGTPYVSGSYPVVEITRDGCAEDPDAWYRKLRHRFNNPHGFDEYTKVAGWKSSSEEPWRVIVGFEKKEGDGEECGLFYLPKDFSGIAVAADEPGGLALSGMMTSPSAQCWRSPCSPLPSSWERPPNFQLNYPDEIASLPLGGEVLECKGHAFVDFTIFALWIKEGREVGWTEETNIDHPLIRKLPPEDFLPTWKEPVLNSFILAIRKIRQRSLYL